MLFAACHALVADEQRAGTSLDGEERPIKKAGNGSVSRQPLKLEELSLLWA